MKTKRYLRQLFGALLFFIMLPSCFLCRTDVKGTAYAAEETVAVDLEGVEDDEILLDLSLSASDDLEIGSDIQDGTWIEIDDVELDLDVNLTINGGLTELISVDGPLELPQISAQDQVLDIGEGGPEAAEQSYCPGAGMSNADAAFGYIQRAMYSGGRTAGRLTSNGNVGTRLQGVEGRLYTQLRQRVEAVARGALADTEFRLNISDLYEDVAYSAADLGADTLTDSNGDVTLQAAFSFWLRVSVDVGKVIDALLADCPYDLYWYDKTSLTSWNNVTYVLDGDRLRIKDYSTGAMCFHFPVAAEYSVSGTTGTYAVDTAKGQSVQAAAENAAQIVKANRSLGDLQKLTAYKDAICDLVEYNDGAASGEIADYGNPWQLVWVFDGDDSTNVVCEGYSKAFQYLCEMSTFHANVSVISVTGYLGSDRGGGGRHMWNLVSIGDVCYMADITNCDEGCVGAPDKLFMKGYSYAMQEKWGEVYYFHVGNRTISYYFDTDIKNLFSAEELGICDDPVGPDNDDQTSGTAGDLTWKRDKYGVLYISGKGAIPDYSAQSPAPWAGDAVKHAYLSKGITAIGDRAFRDCPNLTLVSLNTGITRIGEDAFDVDKLRGENVKGVIIPKCTERIVIEYVNRIMINHSITSHGNMTYIPMRAATCVSLGREYARCESCGDEFEWNTPIDPTNHADIVEDAAVPATCTQDGKTAGSHCEACHTVIKAQSKVTAKGHKPVMDPAVPATIDAEGLTEGSHCSVCGVVLLAQSVVPRLPKPTEAPTVKPTEAPTAKPTATPTAKPTATPTARPTEAPTARPTEAPTARPTEAPTASPTEAPTVKPTEAPLRRISLEKARISVKSQVYSGKAIEPAVKVVLDGKTLKKQTDYVVSYANNKKIGVASVTVRGKGRYKGSAKAAFRINPRAVSGLKLKSGKGRLTASWKRGAGISGYQLQYGLKADFSDGRKVKISKATTLRRTINNLKKGKAYYVRIRAYKKTGGKRYWSAWSAAKKIKVRQ